MEKEKLHRFFAGTTSIQEGMDIRAWMEASEENKRIFYKERKLFDALMVHDDQTTNNCISTKRIPKIIRQWLKIASVIILTLTINYLYQKYKSENEVIAMNTVSVPAGQRTNITLPDGTNVWLNARTTLQYPVTFSQKQRTVFLKGEAYFQVTKDTAHPFRVESEAQVVEVLGTQFNVYAYGHEEQTYTTLVEGKVAVTASASGQHVQLMPGQQASLGRQGGEIVVGEVNIQQVVDWKNGMFVFDDLSLEAILRKVARWYDVEVFYRNQQAKAIVFKGNLPRYGELPELLKVLENSSEVHFSLKGNALIVE